MMPSAVFVAAVASQNKVPLSSKFSRNPGIIPTTYTQHMFCRPQESIRPGFSWKALEGVVGVRCWWVPLAGSQVTVFLLKNIVLIELITTFSVGVRFWQWCVLSPLLFIVYIRVLQTTAGGPNPICEAISSGHKTYFANNEKIYLRKMCCFGRM